MDKKRYTSPELEIFIFEINRDIMNAAGNPGDFDGDIENVTVYTSIEDTDDFPF